MIPTTIRLQQLSPGNETTSLEIFLPNDHATGAGIYPLCGNGANLWGIIIITLKERGSSKKGPWGLDYHADAFADGLEVQRTYIYGHTQWRALVNSTAGFNFESN